MIFNLGPFQLYRVERSNTLDITLKCLDNYGIGWEYGWHDPIDINYHPWIEFRVGKLVLFAFDKWERGFEIRLLGFWWIK